MAELSIYLLFPLKVICNQLAQKISFSLYSNIVLRNFSPELTYILVRSYNIYYIWISLDIHIAGKSYL